MDMQLASFHLEAISCPLCTFWCRHACHADMTVGYFPSENGMARITAVCVFRCSVPWRVLDSVEKQRVVDQRTASTRGQDRSGRQITDPQLFDAPRSSPIDRYALQFNISSVLAVMAGQHEQLLLGGWLSSFYKCAKPKWVNKRVLSERNMVLVD